MAGCINRDGEPGKVGGTHDHMYLCTKIKVTVGVGHYIPSSVSATLLPFRYRGDQYGTNHITVIKDDLASREHRMQEWQKIRELKNGNYKAECYLPLTDLYLKPDAIIDLFNKDFTAHLTEAKSLFKNFDACPQSAQIALMHLIYGVGKSKLYGWTKLRAAVASFNWTEAAKEVSVTDWHNSGRNTLTKNLMNNAASSIDILQKSHKLDKKIK
ncbi:MAG: hypothetical protein IPH09_11905 [bacterium]|nr:hypothetical protein [bacterium]